MGILHNEISRVYDVRPSTSSEMMDVLEIISEIAKSEYEKGREKGLNENRRKGKWIRNDSYVCNQCGYRMIAGNADNFCPQCGSDMRGEYDD